MTWENRAACKDVPTSWFFPPPNSQPETAYDLARAVCAICPVKAECLELALGRENLNDRYGMWGGLTPKQRDRIQRTRPARAGYHRRALSPGTPHTHSSARYDAGRTRWCPDCRALASARRVEYNRRRSA